MCQSRRFFSIEIGNDPRVQVIDSNGDFQLSCASEVCDECTRSGQPPGGSLGAFPGSVVDEVARGAPYCKRRWQNWFDHRADCAGIGRVLGDDIAGRLHGAAARVGKNNNEWRLEHGGAVLDSAEGRSVDKIAGVPRNEEFADTVAAEDQLRGYAAVSAAYNRRPGRLMSGDCTPPLRKVDGAEFRMAHITLVARFQRD